MSVRAIITAGGMLPPELRSAEPSGVKALLRVGPRSLLDAAVGALVESASVSEIAVVGGAEVAAARTSGAAHVDAGASVIENLHRGFMHHGGGLEDEYFVLSPD